VLPGMAPDGLREAVDSYHQAQQELVEARNRLARAIAGAAMSGMTRDEIVDDRISRRSDAADLAGGVDQRSRDRLTAFAGLPECRRRIRFTDPNQERTATDQSCPATVSAAWASSTSPLRPRPGSSLAGL
jgi:hypothetical protein